MSTLYRNYRPEKFKDILGQNHLKTTLQHEIATDSLSHAYIFSGPRAVGKTTMARILAKAVNCETRKKGNFEPCGKCQACLSIKAGKDMEVVEIDAASNTGVDNVRDNIIAFARISPSHRNYKVFIIDEVHMLSISAFNALLKIIEEPPKYVIFILCTTELHKVPGTIISRCQRFDFKKIISSDIIKKLQMIVNNEKVSVDSEVLLAVAKESGGHLRDAESLLGQILALGEQNISLETAELILPRSRSMEALDFLASLTKKESGKALEIINQLIDEGVDIKSFIDELIIVIRKLLLNFAQSGLAEKLGLDYGQDIELRLIELQKNTNLETVLQILTRILKANSEKNQLLNQLPLEIAVFDLCLSHDSNFKSIQIANNEKNKVTKIKETNDIKENKAPEEKNIQASVLNISCQKVQELWPEFLIKIKKHNHSLSFILQNCQPGNLENGSLNLEFKYRFHHDRAQEAAIKPMIEETLTEVFSSPVKIKAILNESMELIEKKIIKQEIKEDEKKTDGLDNILKTFGGQIAS